MTIKKAEKKTLNTDDLNILVEQISRLDSQFRSYTYKQVNSLLTLRNWLIGYYIFEFEQKGFDRAEYGEKILKNLSLKLKEKGAKGYSHTNLKLFRQFYIVYPGIGHSVPDQFKTISIPFPNHFLSVYFLLIILQLLEILFPGICSLEAIKKREKPALSFFKERTRKKCQIMS